MNADNEFSAWYAATQPRLRTTLVAICGDADLGHDVADDAMVRAWARWARVSSMDSREGWVYHTALHLLYRRRRRARVLAALVTQSLPSLSVDDPSAALIWHLVAALPRRQREAVVLRHVADLRQEEIARAMGIARGTVAASLSAAYQTLRSQLQEIG